MKKMLTVLKHINKPRKLIKPLGHLGFFNFLPDKQYLKLIYRAELGKKLNLDNPQAFTEKLQWLKIYNRNPKFSTYVDKYLVRSHVSKTIGEEYLIPLIGVYNTVDQINWNELPNQFAIKCNHGSGTNIICKNKDSLDINESKRKLKKWLKQNWYWFGREWPYKNVKPKIIIEQLLTNENGDIPNDYKFWVFNGEVKFINVHFKKNNKTKINIYNRDWELQKFGMVFENDLSVIHERPKNLKKMITLAEKLSEKLPFVRIDFYEINNRIYFGEITFYPTSGFIKFTENEFDLDLFYGSLLDLKLEMKNKK